ncbi:hypothetical protein [Nocardia cyriacigeorgica]|uniref:hypothetical protein n=1 Tax=Nocardia cyriacigeorgica TaxID=135487 RepID=UPI001894F13D|nr:hypothetical protein [Nocardia cyriacigeorgica]MBF6163071.1 hypothetical protein [Nocardia cyriacigeorgica]MBF6202039.1 hypothetical protein [Nocardia cyriacigeorgica]
MTSTDPNQHDRQMPPWEDLEEALDEWLDRAGQTERSVDEEFQEWFERANQHSDRETLGAIAYRPVAPAPEQTTPEYYASQGVTDPAEQQLRADYARFHELTWAAGNAAGEGEFDRLLAQADAIRDRYLVAADEGVREAWEDLDDAFHDWTEDPQAAAGYLEKMADLRARGARDGLTEAQWRSQWQAQQLADRIEVVPERVNPTVDSVTYNASRPVPEFGADSRARTAALAEQERIELTEEES